jgi:hypothetical protein
MNTTLAVSTHIVAEQRRHAAAVRLYAAECALHDAHQTHVDEWIRAAGDRLHEAVAEHLAAQPQAW